MRTTFSEEQLSDPAMASSEAVIRKCVHCGFCTATCPTYVLLGDELDSPRGRIYLIKDMLEGARQPTPEIVKHVDRCLSCLACMTTCPSGVNYMHLVDHARAYIEERYRRPLRDRLLRALLAWVLPHPRRFRIALRLARLARPAAPLLTRIPALRPIAAMLALAPRRAAPPPARPSLQSPPSLARSRVALLQGCAEPLLRPEFGAAAVRLLEKAGFEVVFAPGEGCCGALVHHMGREAQALADARRNVDAWIREAERDGLTAILVTASGCGTVIKNYGFMLRDDPAYAEKAARISALARDVSEFLLELSLPPGDGRGLTVAYHAACSLQHGQKVTDAPRRLLAHAGYAVRTPIEAHLCCGSAGTYNILQPEIAGQLGARKAANLARLDADVVVTGNIGCALQIAQHSDIPVVHLVELLDWATGGPAPASLSHFAQGSSA
ncbi:glycolate oxidase subunit GlcF [Sphingomonas crusticola]|uniref:glycolate oxidase subunit GlcF n=1 Tax=Sphingomonas crusticola TaxID=1697973 RepID=UPI000E245D01|nr:glycolate oxidase subunit GlcF [Sphingomonas crusticola]